MKMNYSTRSRVAASIEKWLDAKVENGELEGAWVETSKGMGSYETFYVEFQKTEDSELIKIRFSDHNPKYGNCDFYLWVENYKGIREMKAAIAQIIEEAA